MQISLVFIWKWYNKTDDYDTKTEQMDMYFRQLGFC